VRREGNSFCCRVLIFLLSSPLLFSSLLFSSLLFSSSSPSQPDTRPGDVVLVLQQAEHPVFKRDGDDLQMEYEITLFEALCGFQFTITHLDGRVLLVKSPHQRVVEPGDILSIGDEGMPHHKRPFDKGRLIIKFNVKFPLPKNITPEAIKVIFLLFLSPLFSFLFLDSLCSSRHWRKCFQVPNRWQNQPQKWKKLS
jgi:hypothetical protein